MAKIKIKAFIFLLAALFGVQYSMFATNILAHCPLCTAGAGAGLALSRWLGIDDSITGIWIAAFIGATSLWMVSSIKKKYIPFQNSILYLAVFVSTVWSFYAFNLVNDHAGLIMGYPKVIAGMGAGGVIFYAVELINQLIKRVRGSVLFPYQPIAFSLGAMLATSAGMYIFINYYI
jgi:hypothetical protein